MDLYIKKDFHSLNVLFQSISTFPSYNNNRVYSITMNFIIFFNDILRIYIYIHFFSITYKNHIYHTYYLLKMPIYFALSIASWLFQFNLTRLCQTLVSSVLSPNMKHEYRCNEQEWHYKYWYRTSRIQNNFNI